MAAAVVIVALASCGQSPSNIDEACAQYATQLRGVGWSSPEDRRSRAQSIAELADRVERAADAEVRGERSELLTYLMNTLVLLHADRPARPSSASASREEASLLRRRARIESNLERAAGMDACAAASWRRR